MELLTYVELDVPVCTRTYGVAPCTAAVGVTGDAKCYNTRATCQDRANLSETEVTLRFAVETAALPASIDAISCIREIEFSPAAISLGEKLGQRASLTVTLGDMQHSDTGPAGDPYIADRDYTPWDQGTFWGKFRARHRYLRGRALRLVTGEVGQTLAEMDTRHYLIESTDGPTIDGTFRIIAKDILKLADGDRAQAPRLSAGFLVADITAAATSLTLSPSGIGDAEYPLEGWVCIGGKEVAQFRRWQTVVVPETDNDANVVSLIHFESALKDDGAGGIAKSWSISGSAALSTADKKFGSKSLACSGGGIAVADSTDWTFGSGDFTVEFWFRRTATGPGLLFGQGTIGAASIGAGFISAQNFITIYANNSTLFGGGAVITDSNWHHFALVRNGSTWRTYLDGAVNSSTTSSITVNDLSGQFCIGKFGDDIGAGFTGYIDEVRISKGIARYTGAFTPRSTAFPTTYADVSTGDAVTLLARGVLGTAAQAHSAQDRVQVALRYAAQDPADIIADLLETYAGVPSDSIPLASWRAETADFLGRLYTATIVDPTAVATLVSELIEQAALAMWWDDSARQVRLQVLRGILTTAARYDDDLVLASTLQVAEQPDKRISRVQTYFGQINPTRPLSDTDNYRSSVETVDADAETDYGAAAIKRILSRWIPAIGRTTAERLNAKQLARFRDPPRRFSFALLRGSAEVVPAMGGGYRLGSWVLQDASGAPSDVPIQVTRLRPTGPEIGVDAEEVLWSTPDDEVGERLIVVDVDSYNVNLRTAHDSLFPAAASGDTVKCRVAAGVIVGSTSTGAPALDIGSWPAGVTIELHLDGRIQGAGGNGGTRPGTGAGAPGGPALYTRQAVAVTYGADAEIWGGGGGGAAGFLMADGRIEGGGGGAGSVPGGPGPYAYPGTTEAGGSGGYLGGFGGGAGGGPGLGGSNGFGSFGGAAGTAVDGISYVTVAAGSADIRGATVN